MRSWFDALEANDTDTARQLTYERSMLVILAAENGMASADAASLLRRGATEESIERYLGTFAQAMSDRYRSSLADLTVDGFVQLGEIYAAVTVTGDGPATIIARRAPGGLWQIDLVGTVGPALVTQIRAMVGDLTDGPDADTLRDVYRADVLPALQAAALNDPENLALASEIRVLDSTLGD